ncbi:hypothetical protein AVEN_269109-1 [Araneus ventricosus]|uniref:Uncharacterized protein n=1 Tax=Araneus ventricosus TaxID=182803 RepID=A0A4Y2LM58_ARAVE|nr:hypothetical protein AVEN_269109-1 [Araneus ventricosus]
MRRGAFSPKKGKVKSLFSPGTFCMFGFRALSKMSPGCVSSNPSVLEKIASLPGQGAEKLKCLDSTGSPKCRKVAFLATPNAAEKIICLLGNKRGEIVRLAPPAPDYLPLSNLVRELVNSTNKNRRIYLFQRLGSDRIFLKHFLYVLTVCS